jgi:glycosyltransferase involved in cell wall biosynthesis
MNKTRYVLIANSGFMVHNFRYEILQALVHKFPNVTVAARPDNYLEKLKKDPNFNNVEFLSLPSKGSGTLIAYISVYILTFYSVCKIISRYKADVLLTYTPEINFYVLCFSMVQKIHWYPNISGRGKYFSNVFGDVISRLIAKNSQLCFTQNAIEYRLLSERYPNVVRLMGSGVNIKHIKQAKQENDYYSHNKFVFVGRLLEEKGVLSFLKAASVMVREYDDLVFTVIGDSGFGGLSITELKNDFENDNIIFEGWQNDVNAKLIKQDVLIFPSSYGEGLPKVLLEGASAGCILVSTDCPGASDVIHQGRNGYILADSEVSSIIHIIKKIMKLSRQEVRDLKIHSLNLAVDEFNVEIVVNAVMKGISEYESK